MLYCIAVLNTLPQKTTRIACLYAVALFLSVPALADEQGPLLCYENQHLHPYMTGTDNVPVRRPGLLLEIINFAAYPLEIQFERKPWKRCKWRVEQGLADGLFASIWEPDRESWAKYPPLYKPDNQPPNEKASLWTVEYLVFVRNNTKLSWDGTKFHNINNGLSAPLGYVVHKKLDHLGVLNDGTYLPKEGFSMVAQGRIDGYVIEKFTGHAIIDDLDLNKELTAIQIPFLTTRWYLVFSHQYAEKSPENTQLIWQNIQKLTPEKRNFMLKNYIDSDK
ncbi:hypothetical protein [Litoribacillus peritrichatus]